MKKLILKLLVLTSPLIAILFVFIVIDPMMIFYSYESPYNRNNPVINDRSVQARHLLSKPHNYTGFILGSSRSKGFKTNSWKKYIKSDTIFHMGVNDETAYGICMKLKYLDSLGYKIKDVLILLDARILSRPYNPEPHTFREYPLVSGESYAEFYKKFLFAFLNPVFFKTYVNFKFFGKKNQDTEKYFWLVDFRYNKLTGDADFYEYEKQISADSVKYYQTSKVFYSREYAANYNPVPVITHAGEYYLKIIGTLFIKHNTEYRLIITPNYDMKKNHEKDMKILVEIFGSKYVYDYSGINDITKNISNYYEEKHFKPYVADTILMNIYKN